jgi:hypothetical protein
MYFQFNKIINFIQLSWIIYFILIHLNIILI